MKSRGVTMPEQRPIGFWVRTVDRLIDEQFAAAAAETGLTRRQWQILNVLAEHPGPAGRETVVVALAPFLAPGEALDEHLAGITELVTVRPAVLELTPIGRARLDQVRERSVQRLRDRVASGLS